MGSHSDQNRFHPLFVGRSILNKRIKLICDPVTSDVFKGCAVISVWLYGNGAHKTSSVIHLNSNSQ